MLALLGEVKGGGSGGGPCRGLVLAPTREL
eukprot:SAG11_NODE_24078_length_378_cov_1.114695_1_plen_29_part_10